MSSSKSADSPSKDKKSSPSNFKSMIKAALKALQGPRKSVHYNALVAFIVSKYEKEASSKFRSFLRRALARLVDQKIIRCTKPGFYRTAPPKSKPKSRKTSKKDAPKKSSDKKADAADPKKKKKVAPAKKPGKTPIRRAVAAAAAVPITPLRAVAIAAIPASPVSPIADKDRLAKWQYLDHSWRDYDFRASDIVEHCYHQYLDSPGFFDVRAVKSGMWEYMVDFPQMQQTNVVHAAHKIRQIRRTVKIDGGNWVTENDPLAKTSKARLPPPKEGDGGAGSSGLEVEMS